jgi:alkanesulfonate monooxygenase SsuD/methylene tetrahydromethanopterin reductase-like flavin-dependent oxidoreductase (luciferase family)
MRLSIFLDPQEGMTWASIQAAARHTEAGGFEGLYRSDHLAPTSGRFERAATEAWTTLAALAGETSRLRLGTLVTPLTFHEPQVLSKMVSTVCEMAPGRIDVSIGTGWNVGEHEALGLRFESQAVRFERLEEYITVLLGLWGQEPFSVDGRYYRVGGILPRPLPEPRPRLIIGGHGKRRTPLLAARYADDYNVDWPSVEQFADLNGRLDDACREIGRDPATISRSVLLGVIVGEDAEDLRRRARAGVEELGSDDPDAWLAEHAAGWHAGTPDEIVAWLGGYEQAGLEHAMLMVAPHRDVAMIDLIAREVLPRFTP